jgi:hypothetical protein
MAIDRFEGDVQPRAARQAAEAFPSPLPAETLACAGVIRQIGGGTRSERTSLWIVS